MNSEQKLMFIPSASVEANPMLSAFSFVSAVSKVQKVFMFLSNSKRTNKLIFCFLTFRFSYEKNLKLQNEVSVRPKRAVKKVKNLSSFFFGLKVRVKRRNGSVVSGETKSLITKL
ncbi:MAG TPA: hypothetical protein VFI29_14205 [Hanamia sp.]|nr:hypothetical protein [Hanamia sp.]